MIVRIDVSSNKIPKTSFLLAGTEIDAYAHKASYVYQLTFLSSKCQVTTAATAAKTALQCPQQSRNVRYNVHVHTKKTEL